MFSALYGLIILVIIYYVISNQLWSLNLILFIPDGWKSVSNTTIFDFGTITFNSKAVNLLLLV